MAHDLIFGATTRKWSRDDSVRGETIVEGLPYPMPLTAEQKEDLRTYLRHLPAMPASEQADQKRMVAQFQRVYGETKGKAKSGDGKALEKWKQIVKWTNKLQDDALRNDANALIQLQTISKANLFSSRFQIGADHQGRKNL